MIVKAKVTILLRSIIFTQTNFGKGQKRSIFSAVGFIIKEFLASQWQTKVPPPLIIYYILCSPSTFNFKVWALLLKLK